MDDSIKEIINNTKFKNKSELIEFLLAELAHNPTASIDLINNDSIAKAIENRHNLLNRDNSNGMKGKSYDEIKIAYENGIKNNARMSASYLNRVTGKNFNTCKRWLQENHPELLK